MNVEARLDAGLLFFQDKAGSQDTFTMSNAVMDTYKRLPVAFESGSGAWLTDTAGNRYLDAVAGIAVCGLDHAHPQVAEAVARQAAKLVHTSNLYQIPLQEQLAAELCALSGLDRDFFCNSGAEANEAAIKVCRRNAHARGINLPKIIVANGSFHGRTLATLTATGNAKVKVGFEPLVEGFIHVPYNDLLAIEQACAEHDGVIAVMLEPVQGEGGVVVPEPGYLKKVSELCKAKGLLLVLDEVQTGMCRTGKWFAFQHENILPDVMTLSKSLGNGVPIGACLVREQAAAAMTPGSHGTTFGGNPLAASAALAVISYLKQNRMDQRAAELGRRIVEGLRKKLAGQKGVVQIRGLGLMVGIELDRDCAVLVTAGLARHILINVTADRVVRLVPPLILSDAEADQITDTVSELIQAFLQGQPG
jgi:acetylornithine/N-succinyldiaminopimelate aminotransferase